MVERRIYSGWAFTENQSEKMEVNNEIYNKLKEKARVYYRLGIEGMSKTELDEIKSKMTVMLDEGSGYGTHKYSVLCNPNNLSQLEMALVADDGNLCFGYRMENGLIVIHTD